MWGHSLGSRMCQQHVLALVPLQVISYNAAMSTCERSGQWQVAMLLFHELHQQHLESTSVTSSVITRCGRFLLTKVVLQSKSECCKGVSVSHWN